MNKRLFLTMISLAVLTAASCRQRLEPTLELDITITIVNTSDPTQPLTLQPSQTPRPTASNTPWPSDTLSPSSTPGFTPTPTPLPDLVIGEAASGNNPDLQTSLVFVRQDGERLALFRLEANDLQPGKLLGGESDIFSPLWSPDGTQLAFLRTADYTALRDRNISAGLEPVDLYLYVAGLEVPLGDAAGMSLEDLTWSPDSTRLAFAGQRIDSQGFPVSGKDIYQIGINGQNRKVVIASELGNVGCSSPAWSPDSEYLAARCRGLMAQGLVGAALDGTNSKYYDLVLDRVVWHPDGTRMLLLNSFFELSLIDSPFPPQSGADELLNLVDFTESFNDLAVVDSRVMDFSWAPGYQNRFLIQGERLVQVFDPGWGIALSLGGDFSRSAGQYSWGPAGNQIALSYFDGNDFEIGVIKLLEGSFYPLTDNQVDDLMPAWQPFQSAD